MPGANTICQIHHWWALRKLRRHWRNDQFFLKLARELRYKWLKGYFNFYERYQFIRMLAAYEQRRGMI